MLRLVQVLCLAGILSAPSITRAVVLVRSPDRNTSAPTGTLANSGWQWQGRWGDFLGTAISKQYFITAEHVGGSVGDPFVLNGVSYNTTACYDDPLSDLQVWKINGTFPSWAGLYKKDREAERGVVIHGRGTARGSDVVVNNELKGWLWGTDDHVQSWGTNILIGSAGGKADPEAGGGGVAKQRIYWKFDRTGLLDEGTVTAGDSGGGVFIKDLGFWRLAGVNLSVESEFKLPNSDNLMNGALVDVGGLKTDDGDLIPETVKDNAARGFATRIGGRWEWIFQVVGGKVAPSAGSVSASGVPEPANGVLLLGLMTLMVRRRRKSRMTKPE